MQAMSKFKLTKHRCILCKRIFSFHGSCDECSEQVVKRKKTFCFRCQCISEFQNFHFVQNCQACL